MLKLFRKGKKEQIIGVRVTTGRVRAGTKVRALRAGSAIGEYELREVRLGKEVVGEVGEGGECGLLVVGETPIAEQDVLEVFHEEIRKRTVG